MAKYSFSQVQTYVQCPLKYRYKYVERIPVGEFVETADTILGGIVHKCLEILYNKINVMQTPTKDELISLYHEQRKTKEDEAKEKWGEIVIHGDAKLEDYKNRGEAYLTRYYDKHYPFEDIKVIDTELNFIFELEEWINFQMIVDRLDKIWDTFVISDYKTNKRLPTEDKDSLMEQLTLYGIGIKQKYGKYFEKLKARLYFLHFDIEDERDLSQEKLDAVLEKYMWYIKEIESKKSRFLAWEKTIFEAQQWPLCRFCDYQTICPLFSYVNADDEVAGELSEKTLKNLVDDFTQIKAEISDLQKREESLKILFQQYVNAKDPNHEQKYFLIQWTETDVKVTSNSKFTVTQKEQFLSKLKADGLFEQYADIPRQKVNELFTKNPDVTFEDFKDIVIKEISYTVSKVKKK